MAISIGGEARACPGCRQPLHRRGLLGWYHDDGAIQCGSLIIRAA